MHVFAIEISLTATCMPGTQFDATQSKFKIKFLRVAS